jgi:hypothetical protein
MGILLYLFGSRLSILDAVIISTILLLFMNKKYKYAILLFIIGGLVTSGFEILLGI